MSGPKRSRLLSLNCLVSSTLTPDDRSAELHKRYKSVTMALSQYPWLNIGDGYRASGGNLTWEWSMLRQWYLAGSRQRAGGIASGVWPSPWKMSRTGMGQWAYGLTEQDSPWMLFKLEHELRLVTQLSLTSAAGRGTRTGEDSYWLRSMSRQW